MKRAPMLLVMCGVALVGGGLALWGHDPQDVDAHAGGDSRRPTDSETAPAWDGEPATPVPSAETGDAGDEPGRSIASTALYGTIEDASGRAVEQGSVVLIHGRRPVHVARLRPGRHEYEVARLTPGRWTVLVRAAGYAPRRSQVELDGSSSRVRHDVVLEVGAVDVRLSAAEGASLRDVVRHTFPGKSIEIDVIATRERPAATLALSVALVGRYRRGARSGGPRPIDGTMRLAGLPPVHISAVLGRQVLATAHVPQPTRDVELMVSLARIRAELASLRACFVDADTTRPVRGAAAVLIDAEGRARRTEGDFTDKDGSLVLELQPPGRWTLQVVASGYERFHKSIELPRGQVLDLGAVRLSSAAYVAGRVTDAAGKAVRATVTCYPAEQRKQRGSDAPAHRARRDGSFRIPNVGRGTQVVVAQAAGFAPAIRYADTSTGKADGLEVVLERGVPITIDHRIQESNRYLLEVLDSAGWRVLSHDVRSFAWPWRFFLVSGSYTLRVHDRGQLHKTLKLAVGAKPLKRSLDLE